MIDIIIIGFYFKKKTFGCLTTNTSFKFIYLYKDKIDKVFLNEFLEITSNF